MSRARALLLGWAAATPPQLRVFERLYASLDVESTAAIASIRAGLRDPRAYFVAAEPMARALAAGVARPTLVHVFSDNGAALWGALLARLSSTDGGRRVLETVRGVVFDSAPGLWAAHKTMDLARYLAHGTTSILSAHLLSRFAGDRPPSTRLTRPLRVGLTTTLIGAFVGYQVARRSTVRALREVVGHVRARQPSCPNLYLYGSADSIVLPHHVRAWISGQRARGIPCAAHEFEGARHVDLFSSDPQRYQELIEAFVAETLQA